MRKFVVTTTLAGLMLAHACARAMGRRWTEDDQV